VLENIDDQELLENSDEPVCDSLNSVSSSPMKEKSHAGWPRTADT